MNRRFNYQAHFSLSGWLGPKRVFSSQFRSLPAMFFLLRRLTLFRFVFVLYHSFAWLFHWLFKLVFLRFEFNKLRIFRNYVCCSNKVNCKINGGQGQIAEWIMLLILTPGTGVRTSPCQNFLHPKYSQWYTPC